MQKITEIRESYTATRKSRVNGVVTENQQTLTRYRTVYYVEGGARFGHFMLDRICIFVMQLMLGAMLGVVLGLTGTTSILENSSFGIYETLFNWFILQPAFYFLFEYGMQATPGKAILKRVVVDEYGNKPGAKAIFIRSISRAIPFEAFSCLATLGWHDTLSKTFVIRKKDLEDLKLFQKIDTFDTAPAATTI